MRRSNEAELEELTGRCLAAFIAAGTLDLSLDQLARRAKTSKRMLVHYYGSREGLEEQVLALLEERLRAQFRADRFPRGARLEHVVAALWEQSTAPEARGLLRVVMDATRRAWSGSERARKFYAGQQRLWEELLAAYLPETAAVEELLQLFQGAILVFLATGDREQGGRVLARFARRGFTQMKPSARPRAKDRRV